MSRTPSRALLLVMSIPCVLATASCVSMSESKDTSASTSTTDFVIETSTTTTTTGTRPNPTTTNAQPMPSGQSSQTTQTSSTTTTIATKSNTSSGALALSILEQIPQENEYSSGYDRKFFRHWIDADGDGCNTREEVLIAESVTNAQVDRFGCAVIAGDWFSQFDGRSHTDPSNLDIDHLVPLKEAWDSGAHSWTSEMRERFANDLTDGRALIAVTNSVNRSKGDKDPSNWLPTRNDYVCQYISDWIAVKWQWKLSMDASEWGRLKNLLNSQCQGAVIGAWGL